MKLHHFNNLLGLGLRHRFDTEQPTLLDLELVNNRDRPSASSSTGGTTARTNVTSNQDRDNSNTITHPSIRYQFTLHTRTHAYKCCMKLSNISRHLEVMQCF